MSSRSPGRDLPAFVVPHHQIKLLQQSGALSSICDTHVSRACQIGLHYQPSKRYGSAPARSENSQRERVVGTGIHYSASGKLMQRLLQEVPDLAVEASTYSCTGAVYSCKGCSAKNSILRCPAVVRIRRFGARRTVA